MADTGPGRNENRAPLDPEGAANVDRLYRDHSGWLGKILSFRLRSSAVEVDDIVQETYLRVARYPPDEARRHPRALLLRIAVNLARDHMRRNVVRGGLAPADATGPPEVFEAEQHHLLQLKDVIMNLPPIYRDVFVLSRFTGLTYEEIASHVGISVKTVEWRMSRALALCEDRMRD